MKTTAQNAAILCHLSQGHTLTTLQALKKFDCFRLAARIFDLRAAGHCINTDMTTRASGKRVGVYTLVRRAKT